jgi:hypothetical protein
MLGDGHDLHEPGQCQLLTRGMNIDIFVVAHPTNTHTDKTAGTVDSRFTATP